MLHTEFMTYYQFVMIQINDGKHFVFETTLGKFLISFYFASTNISSNNKVIKCLDSMVHITT